MDQSRPVEYVKFFENGNKWAKIYDDNEYLIGWCQCPLPTNYGHVLGRRRGSGTFVYAVCKDCGTNIGVFDAPFERQVAHD